LPDLVPRCDGQSADLARPQFLPRSPLGLRCALLHVLAVNRSFPGGGYGRHDFSRRDFVLALGLAVLRAGPQCHLNPWP